MDIENDRQLFGLRLKQSIQESTQTQKEIAYAIGISGNTLTNYIQGRRSPDALLVANMARMLNINLEWLFFGEGNMHISSDRDKQLSGGGGVVEGGTPQFSKEIEELRKENRELKQRLMGIHTDSAVQNQKISRLEEELSKILALLEKKL